MEKKHFSYLLIAAVVVIALWIATPFVVSWHMGKAPLTPGEFGDMFGTTNALFSGLALIGIVAAILLQQQELKQSTTELRNSARALTRQVELAADTARIQTLPILISVQKTRVETCGGNDFEHFAKREFNEAWILDRIVAMEDILKNGPAEMEKLRKEAITLPAGYNPVYGELESQRYGAVMREIGIMEQKLAVAKSARPELIKLLGYMRELGDLYDKMKNTRFEIAG